MTYTRRLKWDSDFFGYEIGRADIVNVNQFDVEKFKSESSKYKLVYVFSKEKISLEPFALVDEKVVFRKDNIDLLVPQPSGNRIVSFDRGRHDEQQMIDLALESGKYSRFNVDPNFQKNEYSRLYTEWILNSINGKLAFDVIVALANQQILGFTTIAKIDDDLADIGLVAVHPDARGRGVGTELIYAAIERARLANFKSIQVVTQSENIPACSLYRKAEFTVNDITHIYHYWNS